MFCPQCGATNPEDADSCSSCGASLAGESSSGDPEPAHAISHLSSLIMAIASLVAGLLAFLPYVYLASRFYYPVLRQQFRLPYVFDLACLGGFPLGLLGIILGILAGKRSKKSPIIIIIAIIGILLGIGGWIGHAWFFITCQFCQ